MKKIHILGKVPESNTFYFAIKKDGKWRFSKFEESDILDLKAVFTLAGIKVNIFNSYQKDFYNIDDAYQYSASLFHELIEGTII
jgi:hypothetical protein